MTRIVLMRHGETVRNLHGLFQGQADEPLHEIGVGRFQKLANAIHDLPLPAIYCSGFRRAIACARILGGARAVAPVIDLSLGERNLGEFDGRPKADVIAERPRIREELMAPAFRPPAGESGTECIERFRHAFDVIAANLPGAVTAIAISHGGISALFSRHVLGVPVESCFLDHGAFHVFDVDEPGKYTLVGAGRPGNALRETLTRG